MEANLDEDIPYFYEGFEFKPQPRKYLEVPDGRFVLAMYAADGTRVRLPRISETSLQPTENK